MSSSSVADLFRPELAEARAYSPHPGHYAIRLDANEAPPLLSASAREQLSALAAATAFERYPDASATELREALARRTGVDASEILVGVGSDELIALLVTALSRPREHANAPVVLTTTPTFVMYAMSAKLRGCRVLEVPLDADWDLSLSSLMTAIRMAEPNLVFIASPNNPTSNQMSWDRLVAVIEAAPRSLVVIDEAYVDYSARHQLELYRRYEHVAILRTLSKIGFAALRVGWLVARPDIVRELDKLRLPYNLPSPCQKLAAFAVTELASEIRSTIDQVVAERARLTNALAGMRGVQVARSDANFLWLQVERPAQELFEGLKQRGILVRSFHERGGRLAHQLRVTIGTPAENDAFLAAFRAVPTSETR